MLRKPSNTERMKRSAEIARLKENYPQNLVQFHKIGVKLQNAQEEKNEVVVEPDVHLQIDGKEYLVFFNNHFSDVHKVLNQWLENELSEHWFIIPDILKSDIRRITQRGEPSTVKRLLTTLIPIYGQYQGYRCGCNFLATILSSESSEDNNRIRQLAYHVYKTKELIEKYGSEIQSGKICAIFIEKNFNGKSEYIISCDDQLYQKLESKLFEIMSSYDKKIDEKFNTLTKFLCGCEKHIQPTLNEWRRTQFCFVINRVNYFLTREEELLSDKKRYEELEAMTNLRSRLNQFAIKYKYLYLTNEETILKITMSRCKILVKNTKRTTIFIESPNVSKFYKKIKKKLKAEQQILTNKYSDNEFTTEKTIETAEGLNPDKNQELIDELNKEISELNNKQKKLWGDAATEVGKVVIQKVEDVSDVAVLFPNIYSLIQQFNIKDIIDYLTQNKITNGQNNTPLGIAIKAANLTPEQVDKLHSSFNNIVDAQKITDEIKSCQTKLSVMKKVQELSNDFINLLKLKLALLEELPFGEIDINEYLGIIVTEDNEHVVNPGTSSERKTNYKKYEIEKVLNYNEEYEEY
ncbi:hypothetical protein EDI_042290 [Entamoeba dispar SAW760]|uniref:Uncharacterized protein n=1 Tax=Entamoeba dispar (strain ATCC PRA-260 / SAW760) TaxID=370354 RepID=B0ERZ7_ENTDS|nr:uncharacterized protein EDI_042290 [Entamoeba dispar SAW760]EDR22699.1 hypothetical protein EDI_042290 [Entamoeba dispar SAW760]|eukprot:EDR22699.1 hypothetical protein EDI_042290 [Entamoeba dispar SAW760]